MNGNGMAIKAKTKGAVRAPAPSNPNEAAAVDARVIDFDGHDEQEHDVSVSPTSEKRIYYGVLPKKGQD